MFDFGLQFTCEIGHLRPGSSVRTRLQQFRPEAMKLGTGSESGKEGSSVRDIEEKLVSRFPTRGRADSCNLRENQPYPREGRTEEGQNAGWVLACVPVPPPDSGPADRLRSRFSKPRHLASCD